MPPGQSILITGATSGIGRDAALALARAGHLVLAGGRRVDALAALARHSEGRAEPVVGEFQILRRVPARHGNSGVVVAGDYNPPPHEQESS